MRILAFENPDYWNGYLNELYSHPEMKDVFVKEAIGTDQVWTGRS